MSAARYLLFETVFGTCGLAWSERGITRLQLPEATPAATEVRLRRSAARAEGEAPEAIRQAVSQLQQYLSGERTELRDIVLDLEAVVPFYREVYAAARAVGWGETVTYGELARRVGSPGAAQAVGHAMGRNPVALIVPCHRVLAARGQLGGFSAFGGSILKRRLLVMEGVFPSAVPAAQQSLLFEE